MTTESTKAPEKTPYQKVEKRINLFLEEHPIGSVETTALNDVCHYKMWLAERRKEGLGVDLDVDPGLMLAMTRARIEDRQGSMPGYQVAFISAENLLTELTAMKKEKTEKNPELSIVGQILMGIGKAARQIRPESLPQA